ncbi:MULTISPECIES: DUF742 domain-containing protein [Streptomyces]|uniref:DUF742 domain-containing protein n=1 Tax=Streptomyces TaxID=1883 RepID=UPI0022BCDFC2|nr:DUF742 domain-containing protein [Streptomyces diastatochromogenes]
MSRGQGRRLVPSYLAPGGSSAPTRNSLQSLTALIATSLPAKPHHTPAQQRLLDLTAKGPLTVAESAGYLRLPMGVCMMLASQLVDDGNLMARAPLSGVPDGIRTPGAGRPDKSLLERVRDGLLTAL